MACVSFETIYYLSALEILLVRLRDLTCRRMAGVEARMTPFESEMSSACSFQ